MEALLAAEGLELPESGAPEGASEALRRRSRRGARRTPSRRAQAAMDGAARYAPDEDTWTYITQKRDFEEKMAEAEAKHGGARELDADVRAICAPHDGYIADVAVKAGDSYDGSGELFTMTAADAAPVLRADVSQVDRSDFRGHAGVDRGRPVLLRRDAGRRHGAGRARARSYADVEITPEVARARGSIYAMTVEETPMTLVFRAQRDDHADARRAPCTAPARTATCSPSRPAIPTSAVRA